MLTLDILLNNPDSIGRNIRELAGAEGNTTTRLSSTQVRVHSTNILKNTVHISMQRKQNFTMLGWIRQLYVNKYFFLFIVNENICVISHWTRTIVRRTISAFPHRFSTSTDRQANYFPLMRLRAVLGGGGLGEYRHSSQARFTLTR